MTRWSEPETCEHGRRAGCTDCDSPIGGPGVLLGIFLLLLAAAAVVAALLWLP
jgi:hypothetical protein